VTLSTRSDYRELPAPPGLADRFVCLWTQRIDECGGNYSHAVLPDGCTDIVWIGDAEPVVAGPATQCIVVTLPAGTFVVGARLRPGWADSVLRVSADQLLDQHIPLKEILEARAAPFVARRLTRSGIQARLAEAASSLAGEVEFRSNTDLDVLRSIAWLAHNPAGRMRDLARSIGISNRHLQRRFCTSVGYGPKTFQRILRFQRLLAFSSRTPAMHGSLAALADIAGYADQAHMCRDVRALAHDTPQNLLVRAGTTLAMSDLFNTDGGRRS
jgi:AraC-like DNA-binding protein